MIERKLRKYIIPNIFAMTGTSCYILADTFFISSAAGADGITALNLTLPIYGLIFAIGSMTGIGSATQYSLRKSLGDSDTDTYFSNSILWTLLISLVFLAVGCSHPDAILRLLGADDTILATGLTYTRTFLCFTPFFMLNYTFTAFVRNDGAPNIAMAATLASGIFNIIFDYVLMFPLKLGMTGAALATGISPIVSMLICTTHFLSSRNTIRFVRKRPSLRKLLSSWSLGAASFVGEISSGVTTMVFNFILLDLAGNTAVAAYGIVANIALVGTALFNGVSQGLQPLTSEMHGKGDAAAEKRIYRHSLQIGLVLAVSLYALILLFTDQAVAVFNNENSAQLADYATIGMRLYFFGFLAASVNIIRAGFYSAAGKAAESSVIAFSRGIFAIIFFAFLLSRLFHITGVWLAFPVSEVFTLVFSQIWIGARYH